MIVFKNGRKIPQSIDAQKNLAAPHEPKRRDDANGGLREEEVHELLDAEAEEDLGIRAHGERANFTRLVLGCIEASSAA